MRKPNGSPNPENAAADACKRRAPPTKTVVPGRCPGVPGRSRPTSPPDLRGQRRAGLLPTAEPMSRQSWSRSPHGHPHGRLTLIPLASAHAALRPGRIALVPVGVSQPVDSETTLLVVEFAQASPSGCRLIGACHGEVAWRGRPAGTRTGVDGSAYLLPPVRSWSQATGGWPGIDGATGGRAGYGCRDRQHLARSWSCHA